jgi:cardiolipin synthase A/B
MLMQHKALRVTAVLALAFVGGLFFLSLFRPALPYKVQAPSVGLSTPEFAHMMEGMTDAHLQGGSDLQVLTNGESFYKAELDAISQARQTINMEAYIIHKGDVAKQFVEALAARARAGVQVRLVVDAAGSFSTRKGVFEPLLDAGGKVEWYHPLRWYTFDRVNNRTHRELMIIDGEKAFIGGAGIADQWLKAETQDRPRWRDTMVMVQGPAVESVQSTFVENWLESSGEVLSDPKFFPMAPNVGPSTVMVVDSSPTSGGSTRARVLFQELIASAQHSLYISTPYFLPDTPARDEIVRAAKRGVDVRIITPSKKSDHLVTRSSSRGLLGDLLKNGVHVYEYQPSMMHAKIMIVDDQWAVVGSTNFDSRSFRLNDEVNLAAYAPQFARRLIEDFRQDMQQSKELTYEQWKKRPIWERATETFGALIQSQQ